jgi:hypothetical protein
VIAIPSAKKKNEILSLLALVHSFNKIKVLQPLYDAVFSKDSKRIDREESNLRISLIRNFTKTHAQNAFASRSGRPFHTFLSIINSGKVK